MGTTIRGPRFAMWAAAALAAAGLLLAGCDGAPGRAAAATAPAATPVNVQPVERADLTRELLYVADLEASASVAVYSTVADRIEEFPFEDGDEVRAGQRLAVIRSDGLDRGLAQVAAQLEGLEAQVTQAESEVRRAEELRDRGVLTEQAYEQAVTAHQAAVASRDAARASFDQLSITVADAEVTAPVEGVIADRRLERGDMASPQVPLCTVLDTDPIRVDLRLTEQDVARVRVGHPVALALDAYPGETYTGEVVRILPYLDAATRTNTVQVHVPNPADADTGERALKPGMFGRATLTVDRRDQVVVAPTDALMLDSRLLAAQEPGQELRRAYVVDDQGRAETRQVELGLRDGDRVEILAGLDQGDTLVTRGQHQLADGEAVLVVAALEGSRGSTPAAPTAAGPGPT